MNSILGLVSNHMERLLRIIFLEKGSTYYTLQLNIFCKKTNFSWANIFFLGNDVYYSLHVIVCVCACVFALILTPQFEI